MCNLNFFITNLNTFLLIEKKSADLNGYVTCGSACYLIIILILISLCCFPLIGFTVAHFRKLQQYIEDDEQGVVTNTLRVPKVSFTEPEPDYDEDIQRIQTVKSRFNRLERKSIFTIAKITKDQR